MSYQVHAYYLKPSIVPATAQNITGRLIDLNANPSSLLREFGEIVFLFWESNDTTMCAVWN